MLNIFPIPTPSYENRAVEYKWETSIMSDKSIQSEDSYCTQMGFSSSIHLSIAEQSCESF